MKDIQEVLPDHPEDRVVMWTGVTPKTDDNQPLFNATEGLSFHSTLCRSALSDPSNAGLADFAGGTRSAAASSAKPGVWSLWPKISTTVNPLPNGRRP